MTKMILSIAIIMASLVPELAFADDTWLGNVQVRLAHRGRYSQIAFNGQSIYDNIADYNSYNISFQFYKKGITDTDATVWQNVNAQAQLVQDDTQKLMKTAYISVVGKEGNNAVYDMPLLVPDTVFELDPELQNNKVMNAHLNIVMDGVQMLSIPLQFSYQP